MGFNVDMDKCLQALNQLEKKVETKITKEVLTEGAKIILEGEQREAPVGDTGLLKRSLALGKIKSSKGMKIIQIGVFNDKGREAVYGYYQHHGSRRMVGKYWIDNAWKGSKEEAKKVMAKKLKDSLSR